MIAPSHRPTFPFRVVCGFAATLTLTVALPVNPLRAQATPTPPAIAPSSTPEATAAAKPPAEDLSKFDTADKLAARMDALKQTLDKGEQTSEAEALRDVRGLEAACAEFVKRYPQDARRHEARLLRLQIASALANVDENREAPGEDEMLAALREISASADAPASIQADALFTLLNVDAEMIEHHTPDAPKPEAVDARAADFEKKFPDDPRRDGARLIRAKLLVAKDPAAALSRFAELASSKDADVAAEASSQVALAGVREKGLDLKFTAVDGREFDLAKLRGKVVLVDFWATWCGPCVQKLPEIKAAYDKLHDRGFEIVGISLDANKDALTKFTAEKGLPWPQYFDGKRWENAISSRYGIRAIPRAWLVDKTGKVADFDVADGLAATVEKLLAAP